MQQSTPYLSFRGITMTFPGVKALSDISFDCYPGQIHALMGENGAGKSTLLKILSGNYIPTAGHLQIGGQQMAFANTMEALNAGVAIIYQELHLIPEMTVAENIYLGQLPHRGGIVNRSLLNYEARLQLEHLGLDIDPETPLKYLSIGQWQMVEIAKALARNAKIIAFDEPTSSLSAREIDNLFRVIRELREEGRVIIYVSHRMEEIFALSDAITVFKDGRYVCTFDDMPSVSHDALVQAMVGRNLGDIYGWKPRPYGEERLRLEEVKAPGVRTPVSLSVRSGEIVGLFGLVGAGRSELMKGLFGGTQITGGQVYIDGQPVSIRKPAQAIQAGMMLCPEDRKAEGIIPVHSVRDNINISARRKHIHAGCLINNAWEADNADQHIQSLNIKTPGPEQLIMNLSGGNQQKAILGRNTLAIGGNEEAARLAGVPVVRTKIIIFVLSGLVSAAAGIILASRMTSGQPMTSIGYELIVISACVLGGVSLKGGIGKISYVVAGILILGTVENAMNLLNISPFSQYVVRGVILLAAVIFDRYKQKAKRAA